MIQQFLQLGTSSGTTHRTSAPTVPDEDFFSLILKVQGDRIEDQRTAFKPIQVSSV